MRLEDVLASVGLRITWCMLASPMRACLFAGSPLSSWCLWRHLRAPGGGGAEQSWLQARLPAAVDRYLLTGFLSATLAATPIAAAASAGNASYQVELQAAATLGAMTCALPTAADAAAALEPLWGNDRLVGVFGRPYAPAARVRRTALLLAAVLARWAPAFRTALPDAARVWVDGAGLTDAMALGEVQLRHDKRMLASAPSTALSRPTHAPPVRTGTAAAGAGPSVDEELRAGHLVVPLAAAARLVAEGARAWPAHPLVCAALDCALTDTVAALAALVRGGGAPRAGDHGDHAYAAQWEVVLWRLAALVHGLRGTATLRAALYAPSRLSPAEAGETGHARTAEWLFDVLPYVVRVPGSGASGAVERWKWRVLAGALWAAVPRADVLPSVPTYSALLHTFRGCVSALDACARQDEDEGDGEVVPGEGAFADALEEVALLGDLLDCLGAVLCPPAVCSVLFPALVRQAADCAAGRVPGPDGGATKGADGEAVCRALSTAWSAIRRAARALRTVGARVPATPGIPGGGGAATGAAGGGAESCGGELCGDALWHHISTAFVRLLLQSAVVPAVALHAGPGGAVRAVVVELLEVGLQAAMIHGHVQ